MGRNLLFAFALTCPMLVVGTNGVQAQNILGRGAKAAATVVTNQPSVGKLNAGPAKMVAVDDPTQFGTIQEVIFEDFSKMTTGKIGEPDRNTELTSNEISSYPVWINLKPEYTLTEGWGGYNIYPAGGCVAIMGDEGGKVNTPMLDCAGNQGVVFIQFKACTDNGMMAQPLNVGAAETYNMQPSWDFIGTDDYVMDITSEWKTYTYMFYGAGHYTLFNLAFNPPQNPGWGNIYLDDIKVFTVKPFINMPEAKHYADYNGESFVAKWSSVPDATSYILNVYTKGAYGNRTYLLQNQTVNGTSFKVDNIVSGDTYYYSVQAVDKDGHKSFECPEYEVFDLVSPVMGDLTISSENYTATWSPVPSAEVYNYWAYALREAENDGPFTITDNSLRGLKLPQSYLDNNPDGMTWTEDNQTTYTFDAYLINPSNQAGWVAKNGMPYPNSVAVDGFQYVYNGSDAGLVSPELDLSKDGGKISINMNLRGENTTVWLQDGSKEDRVTRCCVALFNWDESKGDYTQAELVYTGNPSATEFKNFSVELTKGSSRSKIGIYAIYAPGNLYIQDLKINQNYIRGDQLNDPFFFARYNADTSVDVTVPEYAKNKQLSHRVSAIKTNPYTRELKESAFSELKNIGEVISSISNVSLTNAPVKVVDGKLSVTTNGNVEIYTINGACVYNGRANGTSLISLPNGTYIVKTNEGSVKVTF
ncbi:MAG: T9SS C-terminal target domain-containing protein [Prevotella sp.]|uniref:T9SS C-terminal target domain-containing protein n=1 Tax=Prevotella sp. TaxID=59823 RepID=UPI002A2B436D|nr:T9SS C-terminal target domain-containing protein [Prevotella sp.]MDD7317401.1 T9SS C-terminal target domain-containing protein [Prevotellaceae bacterium]MDY4019499.1 T9SS C-terminal target domain-containing protein [Prevotella sp.]